MVLTALSHGLITALLGLIGWAFGHLDIGLTAGLAFYLGREVAQHERKESGTNPLRGFYVWRWNLDAKLDMLVPIVVVLLFFTVYFYG
jgi:hypothetical protein